MRQRTAWQLSGRFLRLFAVGLLVCLSGAAARAQDSSLEYAVKATYLYKFAPFVEWPQTSFSSPTTPLVICVIGDDTLLTLLGQATRDQKVGQRLIEVRHYDMADAEAACHSMYIGGAASQSVREALDAVRGLPVLTVTDAAFGSSPKGIIHFVVQGDRVRFEIDERTAAENGIRISSKLLDLAISVRRR